MSEELTELYRKHRPTSFGQVVGQEDAMRALADMGKRNAIPHCLLLSGPSGTGKTTLARILRVKLGCSDNDYCEMNTASSRGIDMVRELQQRMSLAAIGGKCRVWLFDEAHQLTSDGQNALLKMLEDTPSHVYFILCSTDPQKLKATIKTRCTEIKLKSITNEKMAGLIKSVAAAENAVVSDDVVKRIIERAEGSARKALVILHAVIGIKDEEQQLAAVDSGEYRSEAFDIAKALMDSRTQWADICKIIKGMPEESEPEGLRRMILGYAKSVMLGGRNASRAYDIISSFRYNYFDTGMAGLVASCYEVIGKK